MHYFPSSKLPYRFSKVVSFWTFLLIQLGLELRLGVGVGVGFGNRLWQLRQHKIAL
jgi:hypothetical protein